MTTFDLQTATPMMNQWHECRTKAGGALLLFRMGDFYEAFYDDAEKLAKALDLTLTKRQDIPMSGIPYHAFQNYIDRLLAKGYKVAVAEQTEDPKKAKGLVKREVVRIITPGTLIHSNLLNAQTHNYIVALCQIGQQYGLALLDITTADFRVLECSSKKELAEEIYKIKPTEIVASKKFKEHHSLFFDELTQSFAFTTTILENWHFDTPLAMDFLNKHFKVHSLDGFGLKGMMAAINSAGSLLLYLNDHLCLKMDSIRSIKKMEQQNYLLLDHITLNHLEILEPIHKQNKENTLIYFLDQTQTPMGARLLREWVQKPLLSLDEILKRQDAIEDFLKHPYILSRTQEHLKLIADIERLMMKIATNYASAKDLIALKNSLKMIPLIKKEISSLKGSLNQNFFSQLLNLDEVVQLIEKALEEEPPAKLGDGTTFKKGYNENLDEYLSLNHSTKDWLAKYQTTLREQTQIKTLKVGYNRVFGYYIEISKGQIGQMPQSFHRRQTLANGERYISDELKEYESKILNAEEQISILENQLFEKLKEQLLIFQDQILNSAAVLAHLDCIVALTIVANRNHYIKPLIDNSSVLKIHQGRHPTLDRLCHFIPNDTFLDDQDQQLAIITGPNMAGKSTYIRQVALLVIMAQIGSYIPAQSAHLGIVEKIFSRIGASDDLAKGQSTFMVEMVETANILNNLSDKSLIILDEIGRGTSTYDGIAIARSTAEYLLETKAKTLFATHYSELTKLAEKHAKAKNYTVAVHEEKGKITFLYKIIPGCTDKSYGIHVAELAGLPAKLIANAKQILNELEDQKKSKVIKKKNADQLIFMPEPEADVSPIVKALQNIDLNQITPIEALMKLQELKRDLT